MYKYEYIPENNSKEYLDKIYKIEDLRQTLNIKNTDYVQNMNNDIYESVKLEGNSLSKTEVENFLLNDVTIRGKSFQDYAQISNYKNVLNVLQEWVKTDNDLLSHGMICTIHRFVTANELTEKESGYYRQEPVHIRTTEYIPPSEFMVPEYMNSLIDKYNEPDLEGKTRFEKICEFKRNFERIHPFIDGNGRTGRAIMNLLFLQNGYGYISFPANERDKYFQSLEDNTFYLLATDKMLNCMEQIRENHLQREAYDYER